MGQRVPTLSKRSSQLLADGEAEVAGGDCSRNLGLADHPSGKGVCPLQFSIACLVADSFSTSNRIVLVSDCGMLTAVLLLVQLEIFFRLGQQGIELDHEAGKAPQEDGCEPYKRQTGLPSASGWFNGAACGGNNNAIKLSCAAIIIKGTIDTVVGLGMLRSRLVRMGKHPDGFVYSWLLVGMGDVEPIVLRGKHKLVRSKRIVVPFLKVVKIFPRNSKSSIEQSRTV
jgi:hypothetical protein